MQQSLSSSIQTNIQNNHTEQSSNIHEYNIKDNTSYLSMTNNQHAVNMIIREEHTQQITEIITESQIQESTDDLNKKGRYSPKITYRLNKNVQKQKLNHTNRLIEIQHEKSKIMSSLKEVNNQISSIKNQNRINSQLHKRQVIAEDSFAQKNAIQLVKYYKQQKKELEEKKKNQTYKIVMNLKHQLSQNKSKLYSQQQTRTQEKRNAISQRLEQAKKNREKSRIIDRQTNMFISRMLKQQKQLQKQKIDSLRQESQHKLRLIQRSPHLHTSNIHQYQESRLLNRQNNTSLKKQRSATINYPTRKYKKTKWTQQIEDYQQRQKEQKFLKQINKHNGRNKRLKYGELVVSLFSKKQRARTLPNPEQRGESLTVAQNFQSIQLAAPLTDDREINQSKIIKRQTQSMRMPAMSIESHLKSSHHEEKSPQQIQLANKKLQKQKQIRKQTKERLQRLQNNNSIVKLQQHKKLEHHKYQSNYQNYLGMYKAKKHSGPQNWNRILNNQLITKEQKYEKMMRRVQDIQNKAKFKEQLHKKKDDETDDLFMQSIQAKLLLLNHM